MPSSQRVGTIVGETHIFHASFNAVAQRAIRGAKTISLHKSGQQIEIRRSPNNESAVSFFQFIAFRNRDFLIYRPDNIVDVARRNSNVPRGSADLGIIKTGKSDGKVYVAWSKPTEIDTLQKTKNLASEAYSNLQNCMTRVEDLKNRLCEEDGGRALREGP